MILTFDFLRLIFIAALISIPIAWWTMNVWLQGFAYRINISWWVFLVAALLAMLIGVTTVAFQAAKAATSNPIKTLRTQ